MIIKSDNNSIFVGYTKIGFQKVSSIVFKDDNAFVFSFSKKKYILLKKIKMLLDVVPAVVLNFIKILFIYTIIF